MPIISGIRSFDTALVLRGSIPVALLALLADSLFRRSNAAPRGGSEPCDTARERARRGADRGCHAA